MQCRCSLRGDFTPVNNNITHIRRLREHLRRPTEDHNLVPMVIEEGTDKSNNGSRWRKIVGDEGVCTAHHWYCRVVHTVG